MKILDGSNFPPQFLFDKEHSSNTLNCSNPHQNGGSWNIISNLEKARRLLCLPNKCINKETESSTSSV